jgi:hypothetical protein
MIIYSMLQYNHDKPFYAGKNKRVVKTAAVMVKAALLSISSLRDHAPCCTGRI